MATPLYLYSTLFSEVVYFYVLMDLNKVYVYKVARPKPLPQTAKWGKGTSESSHELNGSNGATCLACYE